jgi:hypothetical protein
VQLGERLHHRLQVCGDRRRFADEWELSRILNAVGIRLHHRMVKGSSEGRSGLASVPVGNRFADQQMKQGVVGGGNGSPEAGLLGFFGSL